MSTDSYSEIIEMQKQAMKRVQNMNRQAQATLQREKLETEQELPVIKTAPREPKHTSLPVTFKRREEKDQTPPEPPTLTDETDRAVILSILMLLRSEGADELLLLALLYILA